MIEIKKSEIQIGNEVHENFWYAFSEEEREEIGAFLKKKNCIDELTLQRYLLNLRVPKLSLSMRKIGPVVFFLNPGHQGD